jgi:flagellar basal body rod protein FlgF
MAIIYFPRDKEKRVLCDNSFLIEEKGLIFKSAIQKLDNHVKAGFLRKLDIPQISVEENSTHIASSDKTYEEWINFLSGKITETSKEPEIATPVVEEKTSEIRVENKELDKDESSFIETSKEEEEESKNKFEETKEVKKKPGRPPKVTPAIETSKE